MKKKYFLKFFIALTIAVLSLFLAYVLLRQFADVPEASYDLEVFITQYIVTLLVFFLQIRALSSGPQYFIQIVMLSIVVKVLIYGVFNMVVISISPDDAGSNVVLFLSVYLVITVLELSMLYPMISPSGKNNNQGEVK